MVRSCVCESFLDFLVCYRNLLLCFLLDLEFDRLLTRLTCFLQDARSSGSLHISFKLGSVHSFTSSNRSLAGLFREFSPSGFPCEMVFVGFLRFHCCPNDLTFLFFSSGVSYFPVCPATLLGISMLHGNCF